MPGSSHFVSFALEAVVTAKGQELVAKNLCFVGSQSETQGFKIPVFSFHMAKNQSLVLEIIV